MDNESPNANVSAAPTAASNPAPASAASPVTAANAAAVPPPVPLALTVPAVMLARDLQIQHKIGSAIREHRLRDHHDLEIARQEKQEWVGRCTELLMQSFNGPGAAEQFNNWTARILPEYAEFGGFVELFDDEMKHRLNQLRAIAKSLRNMRDPGAAQGTTLSTSETPTTKGNAMATESNSAVATPAAPEQAAPVIAQAMQAAQAQAALRTQAARVTTSSSNASVAGARSSSGLDQRGLLILRTSTENDSAESVRQFVEQLGLSVQVNRRSSDGEQAQTRLIDELSAMQSSGGFVLLFTDASNDAHQASDQDALFDLGCCVGKLGVNRVIVMQRQGEAHVDRFGLSHIIVDPHDGWRLQLARQLKRAGVDVDLNKLI